MKLLKIQTKEEGGPTPDAFLSFGRCVEKERIKTMYGAGTNDEKMVRNGFYVKVQMPFTHSLTYIDPDDFQIKTGPNRLTFVFRARRPVQEKKWAFTWLKIWIPK